MVKVFFANLLAVLFATAFVPAFAPAFAPSLALPPAADPPGIKAKGLNAKSKIASLSPFLILFLTSLSTRERPIVPIDDGIANAISPARLIGLNPALPNLVFLNGSFCVISFAGAWTF